MTAVMSMPITVSLRERAQSMGLVYDGSGIDTKSRAYARLNENTPRTLATTYSPPYGVPSAQEGLTAVFGMGTGMAPPMNHQRPGRVSAPSGQIGKVCILRTNCDITEFRTETWTY